MTEREPETNWSVITAGPSAGKSSTLRALSARGYRTLPEGGRIVIDQAISTGIEPGNVRDEINFQGRVISKDLQIEQNCPKHTPAFLDRSLADNIAYMQYYDKDYDEAIESMVENQYANIFVLERLTFQDDHARDEDPEEAAAIHEAIIETYEDLGYDVITVPLMPVDERVQFITDRAPVP